MGRELLPDGVRHPRQPSWPLVSNSGSTYVASSVQVVPTTSRRAAASVSFHVAK